jgi:chromosome segregation ATPase
MNDTEHVTQLERQLREALDRISALESKVEAMRVNINSNFNSYAGLMSRIVNHTKTPGNFQFFSGIDVGRGH